MFPRGASMLALTFSSVLLDAKEARDFKIKDLEKLNILPSKNQKTAATYIDGISFVKGACKALFMNAGVNVIFAIFQNNVFECTGGYDNDSWHPINLFFLFYSLHDLISSHIIVSREEPKEQSN